MKKIVLFLALFVSFGLCWNLFNQVQLTKKNGAMCMDGSQANIYTYQPDDDKPPNKLLIYFEQIWEGWCAKDQFNTTISHCYKYVTDKNYLDFGSSNDYPEDMFFLTGILSGDSIFSSWYKVFVKSCDGGSYFSDSSVNFKNKTLNFRGRKNVIESLEYLKSIGWIQNRDEVLLVGLLNGGLAAVAWADYVKQYTKGKVRVLADAAVWENGMNDKTKTNVFESRMKNVDKLFMSNGAIFPNTKCQAANSNDLSKCFYASELVKYVDQSVDVMFLQSYYDGWAAAEILGLDCTQEFASLSECTEQHRTAIQEYHKKITGSLHEMVKLPNIAAFGIACVAHYFTNVRFDDDQFSVPMKSQFMALNATVNWLTNKPDRTHLDEVEWPHNVPCSRKVVVNDINNNLVSE